ncbi:hypothetical protein P170DRAFT_33011 [Aspergillus steynii IBT 23096]|uniref:Uncharacterized protein n=1 Tax=Aspergillus steynii IBT 23096 TaxID=1392250 RepID=A0A2I2GQH1_9EURO|nr:uncharacterized protein P170DRAFT_33011 [Aspergillus steynii IBT 23096]PLB55128.1 hypothetical protein P170DRAFT_33011 [Aspergillus steynii IBT 23096]
MRARYSELVAQYEDRCLPVSVKGDESLAERYNMSFLSVDDRLESSPLRIVPELQNFDIEWTYTLDLDRELFTVDKALHFKLTKIPRFGRWMKYIGEDGHRRRAFKKYTPEEIIGDVAYMPQINRPSQNRYRDLDPEVASPRSLVPDSKEAATHREALFGMIFSYTQGRYFSLLDQSLPEWNPSDFIFRELAFAFLSIAAGELGFEEPSSLNRTYSQEGYFVIPETKRQPGQQRLLPLFLHDNHAPGVEPGSAPKDTTYWMNNVLIHLVTRTDLVDVEEAAIAEVVDFGLNAGVKDFYAMVFSILDVVLIRVQTHENGSTHVRRSPLMALIYFNDKNSEFVNGPRSRGFRTSQEATMVSDSDVPTTSKDEDEDSTDSAETEEDLETESEEDKTAPTVVKESYEDELFTFNMMLRFFDAASKEQLAGARSRILPNEIMTIIMEFSDVRTYQILRKVSACGQQVGNRNIRLNDYYAVVGADGRQTPESFIVEDLRTGERITSTASCSSRSHWLFTSRNKSSFELNPIIGIADASSPRTAILQTISLFFTKLSAWDPEYTEEVEIPVYESHFYSSYSSGHTDTVNKLSEMPTYLYPGSVEKAWGQYITALIRGGENSASRFVMLNNAQWQCLLPPRYRQLRMDNLFCNGFQAFLRHPNDECPVEWERTINYAIAQLGLTERTRRRDGYIKGRPVLVAFGTHARLFYYVYCRKETPTGPLNPGSYSARVAEACTNPDGRHRLVEMTPRDSPLDIRDPNDRTKLENWLKIFSGDEGFGMEWDPITESRQRIGGDKDNADPDTTADPPKSNESDEDEQEGEGGEAND